MKTTSIIYTALLAVSTVDAAALANPVPGALAEAALEICYRSGQPCHKFRRASDACAEALADPITFTEAQSRFCYRSGGACSRAKREALALAAAVAIAFAEADPTASRNGCRHPGEGCGTAKRDALVAAEALADAEALAFPDAKAESEAEAFCYRADGDCHKLKRAAGAIASIMAEEPAELLKRDADILHIMPHQNGCYTPGGGCGTTKRNTDNIKVVAKRAADILHIMPHGNVCHTPGGGCGTGKRDVEGHEVVV